MASNLVNSESLATTTLVIGICMLVSTALVVIVRLFSNYYAIRGLGLDDCSCVIATVLFLIYAGTSLDIRNSARHEHDISATSVTPSAIKKLYIQSISSGPMIFFAKSSLFMLYYRLFAIRNFIRYAIGFGIAISFIIYFGNMTVVGILCAPEVGHAWDWATVAKCSRAPVFGFVLGIANLALDMFLLILPIPVILGLQLSAKKKIGVLAIFMVGFFALAASIVSLVYRIKLWQGTDPTWNGFICVICAMIETGVTIMCSSTSALVAFWKSHIAVHAGLLSSRLCFGCGEIATRFKFVSRASSDTQTCPPDSEYSKSDPSLYNLSHVELDAHHRGSTTFSSSTVRTEIGCGSPTSVVDQG